MKKLLLLLFVCPFLTAHATTYYFSSSSGDDSRSASQARSSSTPWKSLSKLNAIFSSLQPGDAVLLKRGDTFFGSITVNKSGTSSSPIVIGDYGSGNKPVITSLVKLTGWVSKGNGIWESYNSTLSTNTKVLVLNGFQQELGRYPNSNAANKGYLYFESHNGTTSITDKQLTSSTNWSGADVVIRPRRWVLSRNTITSHSGSTIYYKASTGYAPQNNYGYFITNSIKTLDRFGEWYYNKSTHKMSVYSGSNNPSSYTVQSPASDNIIKASSFSYVTFNNLVITGANASAVDIRNGSHVSLTNCDINFSGENGVKSIYHTALKVEGCTINNSNFGGICMGYSGDNAIIRNNKILNTSVFAGMAQDGDQAGLGIMSYGNNNIIEYNQIRKVGFNGITFNGNNVTIKNNYIDSFCFVKDDGGAIYTVNSNANAQSGRKITGNIISNGIGAPDGAYNPWTVPTEGIYVDNGSMYIEISGNTVSNLTDQGIFLHNSKNIKIANNVVYNAKSRYLSLVENSNHPQIRNCSVSGNVFFKTLASQSLLYIHSDGTDEKQFATFSGNYYASPADNNISSATSYAKTYESTATVKSYSTSLRFEYNATQSSKTVSLDAIYIDAKNNRYSGSITLNPFTSIVLIKTGASTTTSTSPVVKITSPTVGSSYKAYSTVNMSATASDADGTVKKVDFYKGSTLLHTETTAPYTYSWQNVPAGNYTLTAKATDNSGKVTTSSSVTISVYSTSARSAGGNSSSNIDISDTANTLLANKSPEKLIDFRLFPNPAVNTIKISFEQALNNQKANLTIQAMTGGILKNLPLILSGKTADVDISSLSSGVYIMSLRGENFTISKKFIKIN